MFGPSFQLYFFSYEATLVKQTNATTAAKVSNLSGRICKYLQLRKNAVSMRMLLDNPAPQTTWDQVATMFRCTLGCHVTRGGHGQCFTVYTHTGCFTASDREGFFFKSLD